MKGRIAWIDASKGIGIFLVILGHTTLTAEPRSHIFAFHMALFFFLSGSFFSAKNSFKNFLAVKVKSLLVPYFAFVIISMIMLAYFSDQPIDIKNSFLAALESKRNYIQFNVPLWFLTSLFVVELIFYFISRFIKNNWVLLLTVLIAGFFSFSQLQSVSGANILPWSIDQSLYFLVFFGIGYIVRGWLKKDLKKSPLLITLSGLYIWFLWDSTFYQNIWNIVPLFSGYLSGVVWALLAISFVIFISQFLADSPLLNAMGRNSLTLMALHTALSLNCLTFIFVKGCSLKTIQTC